jgi:hypothetical protein
MASDQSVTVYVSNIALNISLHLDDMFRMSSINMKFLMRCSLINIAVALNESLTIQECCQVVHLFIETVLMNLQLGK